MLGVMHLETMDRKGWVDQAIRLARPVLTAMANGRLREHMPMQIGPTGQAGLRELTHMEALSRTLAGLSPWLASGVNDHGRIELAELAVASITQSVDPASPDRFSFDHGGRQRLVEAAFLSHAFLRGKTVLWEPLTEVTRQRIIAGLRQTRDVLPGTNNWLLFSAMVEAFLASVDQPWDQIRVDYAIRQHEQWYKGDSIYGDGVMLAMDYYNSYVIQPMLLDIMATVGDAPAWRDFAERMWTRAKRYAAIQERLIGPDGTFPPIGRSLAYRCGAFQHLAQVALQHQLPDELPPAQVRCALAAVIKRTLDAPGTFDANGWLHIGLGGDQPSIADAYISTGSLYLCATAFLPLGLAPTDPFWADKPLPWTQVKVWSGVDMPGDHAIH